MSTRVLVVEDDSEMCLVFEKLLEGAGYEVLFANHGKHALEILEQQHVRLIISDWMMPQMDGLELCQKVKSNPDLQPNYFLLLTVREGKKHCIEGLVTGADDYVSKLAHAEELVARVKVGERILKQQQGLQSLALLDYLTGLKNRRAFEEDLDRELARAARYRHPLSLLLLDVDKFKEINDSWGHITGDEVLKVMGRFLKETTRLSDSVYRIGGDEFTIILAETSAAGAQQAAARIKFSFAAYAESHKEELPFLIHFSTGCATVPVGQVRSKEELIEEADRNMYNEKGAREQTLALAGRSEHG